VVALEVGSSAGTIEVSQSLLDERLKALNAR